MLQIAISNHISEEGQEWLECNNGFQLIGPWEIWSKFLVCNFHAIFSNWWLKYLSGNDLRWMSLDLSDDKSTLVQVMAWCHQATSHYLCNVDPNVCCHMASLGHNELNLNTNTCTLKDHLRIQWITSKHLHHHYTSPWKEISLLTNISKKTKNGHLKCMQYKTNWKR